MSCSHTYGSRAARAPLATRSSSCETPAAPRDEIAATTTDGSRAAPAAPATVDATAAGDTFDGVFLAALAAGADPLSAAERANAAAALSPTGYGGVAPIPDAAAVDAFMVGG